MLSISKLLKLDAPLVLASSSPRRKKLLEGLGFEFEVFPSNIDEKDNYYFNESEDFAKNLAILKAQDVASRIKKPCYVIGADTIVVLDDKILNKPIDKAEAKAMLNTLSGRTHIVFTGIAIVNSTTMQTDSNVQRTEVTFRNLDEEEIDAYIETGSPMDKAGAYGIQDDFGAVFVENIVGCYYNIVGLPLEMLYKMLKELKK